MTAQCAIQIILSHELLRKLNEILLLVNGEANPEQNSVDLYPEFTVIYYHFNIAILI